MKKILAVLAVLVAFVLPVFAQSDILTGDYSSAGWSKAYPAFSADEISVTVTNGQALTVAGGKRYKLVAAGQDSGYTNTITLAQPYYVSGIVYLRNASTSTNLIKIANGSTVKLGVDWIGAAGDTLTLDLVAKNIAAKVASSCSGLYGTKTNTFYTVSAGATTNAFTVSTNVQVLVNGVLKTWTVNGTAL